MTRNTPKLRAVFLAALMVLSVFAGAIALGGTAVAQSNLQEASDQADDTWETQTSRYQGQSLYFEPASDPTTNDYVLRHYDSSDSNSPVGEAIRQVQFSQTEGGNYYAHVDTSSFEGQVVITKNGRTDTDVVITNADGQETGTSAGGTDYSIEFFVQSLDASWSPDSVAQDGTAELELATGRTETYNVEISSDNLSVGQLQDLFSNAEYEETSDGGIIVPTQSADLTADFSQIDEEPGDYTFNVDVTDTSASDTATITVDPDVAPDANFDQPVFEEERGDNATISLQSESLDQFNVTIGNEEDVAYEANLVVTPNEDGEVVLTMNTYKAGGWDNDDVTNVFTAVEGDILENHDNTTRVSEDNSAPLQPGLYDVIAHNPNTEYDVAAVDITARSTDGATVYTAPDYSGVSTLEEVRAGQSDGSITESSEIAQQDALVVEVEASGIYSLLGSEANPVAFLESDSAFNLSIVQSNPGVNRDPHVVDLDGSTSRIIQDAQNNTFYYVLDSDSIQTDESRDVTAGDEFDVEFEVGGSYALNDESETVNDSFSIAERTASFDTQGGEVVVEASENGEIAGSTSVAPGTEFTIRARATGENPFLKTGSATVSEDGTFSTTMDFSDVASEQQFKVSIPNQGFEDNAQTDGRVGDTEQASVSLSDVTATEGEEVSSITVDSAFLPNGGFVTIHDGSLTDGATFDSVRGTSDYLSEGENSDVEVTLDEPYTEDGEAIAMAHQDTNDNQEYDFVDTEGDEDGAYTDENDDAIVDSASVTFEPESTPTETPGGTDTATETATETGGDDADEQAGFGAIVALIALLGAALLAARRNAF